MDTTDGVSIHFWNEFNYILELVRMPETSLGTAVQECLGFLLKLEETEGSLSMGMTKVLLS